MQITFRVNTTIPLAIRGALPYTESTFTSTDIANTVAVYIPNAKVNNRYLNGPRSAGPNPNGNGYLTNGATFTAVGFEAKYLLDNYTTGLYPVLSVVSQS